MNVFDLLDSLESPLDAEGAERTSHPIHAEAERVARRANSWGKVQQGEEQMVFAEATLALPLVAGYAYHRGAWRARTERRFAKLFAAGAAR